MDPKMNIAALTAFLAAEFPQVDGRYTIRDIGPMTVTVSMSPGEANLRPGGTVSGPTLFALADMTVYVAVLAMIGPEALAVTTNASIDFMRKPEPSRDLVADCRLLKLGRRLAVGDVLIRSDGSADAVARATLTYSIPPRG